MASKAVVIADEQRCLCGARFEMVKSVQQQSHTKWTSSSKYYESYLALKKMLLRLSLYVIQELLCVHINIYESRKW